MRVSICVLLAALVAIVLPAHGQDSGADDPAKKPWVGVGMEGRRVTMVANDSPAERSGLREGDLVQTFGGVDIDSVAKLVAFLADKKPGDEIPVVVTRGDAADEVKLTLVLGSRLDAIGPMGKGGRTEFRDNDQIRPDLVDYEDELSRRFLAHLQDDALNKQWLDVLAKRRAQREAKGEAPDPRLADSTLQQEWERFLHAFRADERALPGYYKPELQSYIRREPLKFEKVTRDLLGPLEAAAYTHDLVTASQRMFATIDVAGTEGIEPVTVGTAEGDTPFERSARVVAPLLARLAEAQAELDAAFAQLSASDREFLATQLPVMAHRFAAHIYLDAGAPREEFRANLRALDLTKRIDYSRLQRAVALTASIVTPETLDALRTRLPKAPAAITVPAPGAWINTTGVRDPDGAWAVPGLVVLADGDTSWQPELLAAPAFGSIRVTIDLAGDDTYHAPDFGGIGSAIGGICIHADLAGDDRYLGKRVACGSAIVGAGILLDLAGNDVIVGDAYIGGAALFGLGMLVDSTGNDVRKANLYSWGFAGPKACGALFDGDGEDHSIADGQYPTSYGAPEREYEGNSFGLAIGFRQIAAGGVAIYSDRAGHDIVSAGEFSIGGSYFLGVGIYHDAAGDDIIHSSRYGVGFGVHSAAGIALDDGGNDIYQGQTAASLGSSWDLGVGMLIDTAGNDVYVCKGLGLGGAAQNGFALLWDKAGNDIYRSHGGTQGEGTGFEYGNGRGAKNFGVLWDDGGTDSYNRPGLADGVTRLRGTIGIAADR